MITFYKMYSPIKLIFSDIFKIFFLHITASSNRIIFYLIRCRCLLLRRTAGAVYSRLIGCRRHDALMIQMAQLIQLGELLRLLHRILGVGLQLLMMRLVRRMSRLMMRRREGGYRERDEQHRAAEDVRTTSTQCPRLLPTPFSCVFGFG